VPPFGGLRVNVAYMVHLWLVGKCVVDFLLMLIELFRQLSRLRRYELIWIEIVVFERRWVTLNAKFRGRAGHSPTTLCDRKLESLRYHVVLFSWSDV